MISETALPDVVSSLSSLEHCSDIREVTGSKPLQPQSFFFFQATLSQ